MKHTHYFILIAILPVYMCIQGCESSIQKQDVMQAQVIQVTHGAGKPQKTLAAEAQKAAIVKEWDSLKSTFEKRIQANEIFIAELEGPIKLVAALERRNNDMKVRMEAYQPSLGDWEVFKRAFNNDMEELRIALKEAGSGNKK